MASIETDVIKGMLQALEHMLRRFGMMTTRARWSPRQVSMGALLLGLISQAPPVGLALEMMPPVSAMWIAAGLAEFKAAVVPHGLFWVRFTHPPGVAVARHVRIVSGLS